ncbi:MAG: glycosyltransferase 87 family protein [Labedaea sp.]
MSEPAERTRALRFDLLFYLTGLTFAVATAFASEFYDYRVWGNFATLGYLFALGVTLLRRSRWLAVAAAALLGVLAPTLFLVLRRVPEFRWGPWPWSFPAQPEVWVVERSARLLLDHGTPYADLTALGRPPVPDDYTPYGPVMTVFGLPRAVFGDAAVTDARLVFLAVAVLAVLLSLRSLGWPRVPVVAAQLAAVSPLTGLTVAVAGDDLAVTALIVLATVLVYRAGPVPAGLVAALAVNAKLSALPALAVLVVAVAAARGRRALAVYLGTVLATTVVVVLPVLLAGPGAFVEHVIKFPAGLGLARSPAGSPLPGHLIASAGPAGPAVAMGLLAGTAVAIAVWLLLRPPRSPADTAARIAVGLGAAIVLAPATRWGYLIYPLTMLGAMITLRTAATPSTVGAAEPHLPGDTPVGPTESPSQP